MFSFLTSRAMAILTLASCLLLNACALIDKSPSQVVQPTMPSSEQLRLWNQRLEKLSGITQWQLKGRMAVRTTQRSGSATVRWDRGAERDNLDIYGPFGSGHIRIKADASGASLIDASQTLSTADNIRDLLYEEAGWPVPFDALKYWIVGVPVPASKASWQLDADGRLQWLQQAGWMISYDGYQLRDGIEIPAKLQLEALPGTANLTFPDGQSSDQLKVKLVIKELTPRMAVNDDNLSSASEN